MNKFSKFTDEELKTFINNNENFLVDDIFHLVEELSKRNIIFENKKICTKCSFPNNKNAKTCEYCGYSFSFKSKILKTLKILLIIFSIFLLILILIFFIGVGSCFYYLNNL